MSSLRRYSPLLVLAVAACMQLTLVMQPAEYAVTNFLPDDAFYYFKIAQHIAAGDGSTFDGESIANGYHPLWTLVTSASHMLFGSGMPGDWAPIRAVLLLSVALNIGTGLLVWRILRRFSGSIYLQGIGLFVFALNPYLLYETINGLETSLGLFLFSGFFLMALREQEGALAGRRSILAFGVVGGLMTLARLDLGVYLAAYLVWRVWRDRTWRVPVIIGAIAAVFLLPWLIWNYAMTGMLMTTASETGSMVVRTLTVQDNGASFVTLAKAEIYYLYNAFLDLAEKTGMLPLFFAILGALMAYIAQGSIRVSRPRDIRAEHALFIGFLLLWFANVGVRWMARTWYFVSFDIFVAIGVVLVLGHIGPNLTRRSRISAAFVFVACAAFLFFVSWSREVRAAMAQQADILATAAWENENLPDTAKIAVFNAGVHGYFSRHTVVNIDGLVNLDAYHAMREKRLYAYLYENGITHVADWPYTLSYRYRSFLGNEKPFEELKLVHVESGHADGRFADGLGVYELRP